MMCFLHRIDCSARDGEYRRKLMGRNTVDPSFLANWHKFKKKHAVFIFTNVIAWHETEQRWRRGGWWHAANRGGGPGWNSTGAAAVSSVSLGVRRAASRPFTAFSPLCFIYFFLLSLFYARQRLHHPPTDLSSVHIMLHKQWKGFSLVRNN